MELPNILTETDGYIQFKGHRIGLHHVIYYYNEGYNAEMLAHQYDTLSLYQIRGAIEFYLKNRDGVDAYIAKHDAEVERLRAAAPPPRITREELMRRWEAKKRAEAIGVKAES